MRVFCFEIVEGWVKVVSPVLDEIIPEGEEISLKMPSLGS